MAMKQKTGDVVLTLPGGRIIRMFVSKGSHRSFRNKGRYEIPDEIYGDPDLAYLLTRIKNEKKRTEENP